LEKQTQILGEIALKVYGGMPIQAGWCYGYNTKLNGLEYHKGNEVAIAATDMVLLLGHMDDIAWGEDFCFDSKKVVAFFVEAGTVVEQFATTLHFAPNQVKKDEPFITAIILPKGTNLPLSSPAPAEGESKMLTAVNKWLLVHPDLGFGYPGIQGENIEVKPVE